MFLRPFGIYCSACFAILFVSILLRVVATFPGTVLFPLLCSVLPLFMFRYLFKHIKYIIFGGAAILRGPGPPHC